jgi:hypothetical protein
MSTMADNTIAQKITRATLVPRLLAWLDSQGIEPNEMMLRHVLGIAKSMETRIEKD